MTNELDLLTGAFTDSIYSATTIAVEEPVDYDIKKSENVKSSKSSETEAWQNIRVIHGDLQGTFPALTIIKEDNILRNNLSRPVHVVIENDPLLITNNFSKKTPVILLQTRNVFTTSGSELIDENDSKTISTTENEKSANSSVKLDDGDNSFQSFSASTKSSKLEFESVVDSAKVKIASSKSLSPLNCVSTSKKSFLSNSIINNDNSISFITSTKALPSTTSYRYVVYLNMVSCILH